MHYFVSFLVLQHLNEEERAGCFAFIVLQVSCYCKCSVVSPYHTHYFFFIVKYNVRLKTLLQQGISEPFFYGNLVYKFKIIVVKPYVCDQFKKIIKCYKKV